METLLGIGVGLGLSAACGFRVFVPLLVMSVASRGGHLAIDPSLAWICSDVALVAFGCATLLELFAYCIPGLDNALDTIATPAAVVAGTVVAASCVKGMSPFLTWSLGIIAGGGVAGTIQATTTAVRASSTVSTGGLGNSIVAGTEAVASVLMSVLAVFLPLLAMVAVVGLLIVAVACAKRTWDLLVRRGRRLSPASSW